MSRILSRLSRALLVAALMPIAASSASAQTTVATGHYLCKYPLIGIQPVTIRWTVQTPNPIAMGEAVKFSAEFTGGKGTVPGFGLVEGLASLEGTLTATTSLKYGGGLKRWRVVNSIAKTPAPGSSDPTLNLSATGQAIGDLTDVQGAAPLSLIALTLRLTARDAAGVPIILPPLTKDIYDDIVVDVDSDPTSFNVSCKPQPDVPLTLATLNVGNTAPCWITGGCPRPGAPSTPEVTDVTETTAHLEWIVPEDFTVANYKIKIDGLDQPTIADGNATDLTGLKPDTLYQATISAISQDPKAVPSEPVSVSFKTKATVDPLAAPTLVPFTDGFLNAKSATIRWDLANPAVAEFEIVHDGKTETVPGWQRQFQIAPLEAGTSHTATVTGKLADGTSTKPLVISFTTPQPPSAPSGITTTSTQTSITISWNASTGPAPVAQYEVRNIAFGGLFDGEFISQFTTDTSLTWTGLPAGTDYKFQVVVTDKNGSEVEAPAFFASTSTPEPITQNVNYDVTGSIGVGALARGFVLVQKGGSALIFTKAKTARTTSQTVTGTLSLGQGQGRLVALGFLPVTAKLAFVSSGAATGTLNNGALSLNQKLRIKVLEAKLFGAIPLAGGNNCQTKQLSDVNLKSTAAAFEPSKGGPLAGTFSISDLNGCGPLDGLVSPLTAGSGNTIALNLTPKPGDPR